MGKRRNKPAAILGPTRHHPQCCCDRCLDDDTVKLEKRLEAAWEQHEREKGTYETNSKGTLRVAERMSPVIGPFEGTDKSKALYLDVPLAICVTISPKGRRRK